MPWNENKDGEGSSKGSSPWGSQGKKADSPWSRPGGSGGGNGSGSGGGGNRPDLEEQMRRMQERFRRGRGNGGGGRRGGGGQNFGPFGFIVIGFVALLAWLFTGVVVVDEGETAAVFRFGQWQKNFGPGLHVHLPTPIESHEIMPSQQQQVTEVGSNEDESLMLTGDENIVEVQYRVFWYYDQDDPENFILNVDDGYDLVKAAAESVMREVVGKSNLDDVITTGRNELQAQVREQLQALLNDYRAGVQVLNVEIQEAQAPAEVRDAFIDVVNAGQDAERAVQVANRYANDIIPRARGEAQQILQDAEAYREQVIADATGQANRFTQILTEYQQAPQVTRERMYLESMERVLNRSDKLILDNEAGAVPYLPLDSVNRSRNQEN
ncbi:MAG: FtsH protease activity modulator HflK [Hyphomonadaceae bacterium]|mgnify:CR=1 FL=1|jgi:membrane protease subunit HflK|nr:FtsH protease activity modulator HflK [Hyphomonadaceae bacterium]PHR76156.1 MAG: FtsH protease activity modulator HflK [Henriciella sp.]|tara:strand:+ start:30796 stop:31941 length:1146 start_codon:yes stop_codon:yes gene_type:complete